MRNISLFNSYIVNDIKYASPDGQIFDDVWDYMYYMREKYEDPRMEVYVFEEKDLIVCSTGEDNGSQDPNENEEF